MTGDIFFIRRFFSHRVERDVTVVNVIGGL